MIKNANKSLLLLSLMVLVPLLILVWFGLQWQQQQQRMLATEFERLQRGQLQALDQRLGSYFERLQQQLLIDGQLLGPSIESLQPLQAYLHQSIHVQNIYVADADGQRLYPSQSTLSNRETAFLRRTNGLWSELLIESAIEPEQGEVAVARSQQLFSASLYKREAKVQLPQRFGWKVWYADTGIQWIWWMLDEQQRLLAFELNSARLFADMINLLPASDDPDFHLALVRLLDEKQRLMHQWGGLSDVDTSAPLLVHYLAHPLGSWQYQYWMDRRSLQQPVQQYGWLMGVFALALALVGLAIFLYRDQQRHLREASQRVNFVNQVSHELKTPLTNIRMYAELMDGELYDEDEKPRRYLQVITAESQRLSRLIENVLNVSRSQNNKLKVRPQAGVVDEAVRLVMDAFAPALQRKGMVINFNGDARQTVQFDPEIFEQIVTNLFSNCEKYAQGSDKIDVATLLQEHELVLTVRDYGPGIPVAEQQRIFESFYRVSSELTDGVSGTGIGLHISRQLAQLHGGDLRLLPADQGACFELRLQVHGSATNNTGAPDSRHQ